MTFATTYEVNWRVGVRVLYHARFRKTLALISSSPAIGKSQPRQKRAYDAPNGAICVSRTGPLALNSGIPCQWVIQMVACASPLLEHLFLLALRPISLGLSLLHCQGHQPAMHLVNRRHHGANAAFCGGRSHRSRHSVTLIEMLLYLWNLWSSCSVYDFEFPDCCSVCSVNGSQNDLIISSSSTAVKFLGDGQEHGLKSLQHRKWPQQPL
jgi:hypothetical protein